MTSTVASQVDARRARTLRLALALCLLLLTGCGGGYGSGGGGGMMGSAPSIITQPASQTVAAGSMATFTVAATGATGYSLSYQWYKTPPGAMAAAVISGATMAGYTTPAATSADNGSSFYVMVSNAYGNVRSSSVVLTVM